MANDTDIFKDVGSSTKDSDIFKDISVPKPSQAAQANEDPAFAKYPNMHPKTKQAVLDIQNGRWGEGAANVAYKAGGAVTDFASQYLPPKFAAGLGYLTNVGIQAIPALFGGTIAAETAAPALQAGARGLMQSAVKPTLADLKSGDAARAIDTMLQKGFNPTEGGVRAMQTQIDNLGSQVSQLIANSPATVNKYDVANRLNDAIAKFSKQVNPKSDTDAIYKAWDEFLAHPLLAGKNTMPVQLAQDMKTATYRSLGDKPYGELSGAANEAQKALARGLKEEISAAVPAVSGLNAEQAALINARDIAQRRALMSGNRNPMSLALLAPDQMKTVGFLMDKSDLIKSLLARGLYANSRTLPLAIGGGAGGALGMYMGQPPEGVLAQ